MSRVPFATSYLLESRMPSETSEATTSNRRRNTLVPVDSSETVSLPLKENFTYTAQSGGKVEGNRFVFT